MSKEDRIMKNINFKKLIPCIISLFVILGMAAQSFATDVDLSAFVPKEEFDAKYYELNYRVKNIEDDIERTYKFVCTNVKTFAGTPFTALAGARNPFNAWNTNSVYHWMNFPIVDFSDPKALRFNSGGMINLYGSHYKVSNFEYEIPATLCKWRDGIELGKECKVKFDVSRTWGSGTGPATNVTDVTVNITLGPFKKFPKITTAGSAISQGYVCDIPAVPCKNTANGTAFYYAYGTETEPTSWTSDTGRLYMNTANSGNTNYSKFPTKNAEYLREHAYSKDALYLNQMIHFNTVPAADFSTRTNLWLKYTYQSSSMGVDRGLNLDFLKMTNWNNK